MTESKLSKCKIDYEYLGSEMDYLGYIKKLIRKLKRIKNRRKVMGQ